MISNMILQFILAMAATLGFAIIYNAPKKQYIFCGISGAFAWIIYLVFSDLLNGDIVISSLIATFLLTILSRIFSVIHKNPVTIYLVTGIFTLVPGAGIYYSAYYLIMSDMAAFQLKAIETFKIAGAMVIGIVFGFAIPQQLFMLLSSRHDGKDA